MGTTGTVDGAEGTGPLARVRASGRGSFLFAMFYGGGNVDLILPLVRRLIARDHEVCVLAGPRLWPHLPEPIDPFLQAVKATGAKVVALPEPAVSPHDAAPPMHGLLLGWTPRRLKKAVNIAIASRWSSIWAAATTSQLPRERPDVVVADHFLLGAVAAAERAGVPIAVLVHNATHPAPQHGLPPPGTGFDLARNSADRVRDLVWAAAFRRVAVRDGLPLLNRARADIGLGRVRSPFEQYQAATRVLVLASRTFDFPARRLPENVRYTGTIGDDVPARGWEPPWAVGDSRPLVLVSLSTLDQGQGPLMHRILGAVGELPVRALVTLGPSLDAAGFEAPPNAHLLTFVPHAAVLPSAAVVVTQCGLNTVTKALLHGVPLVCIPLTADQPDNAARVVARGAGVRLSRDSSTREIRAAIERVLDDAAFRESARRLGGALALENGADNAAGELEALVQANS